MYRQKRTGAGLVFAVLFVIVFGFIGCGIAQHKSHFAVDTLCAKERVAESNGGSYRVYGVDRTYAVEDSHWLGKWRTNTADVYGALHVPGRYEITYLGFRMGLGSYFPNIWRYKRIDTTPSEIANVEHECNSR